ncbi:MAG: hypothetical protein Aurels2KO_38910 [Aureliella sp.]
MQILKTHHFLLATVACLFPEALVYAQQARPTAIASHASTVATHDGDLNTHRVAPPKGRLAIVADGNSPDPDDIGATAVIFGLLKASGLNDRLVHLSHSCDLKPVARISAKDELRRQKVMQEVCDDGIDRFGPYRNLAKAFNCRTEQQAAVDDLRDAINDSSMRSPLWIIEAGEPDIIGYALEAADPAKRQHVHVVSHHPANDNAGDFYSWQQILDFGVTEHQIGDQNVGLKTAIGPWDWAKSHPNANVQWIREQLAYAEQDGVVKFQTGKFDCSDAGMVLWWITGADAGGNKHSTPADVANLLTAVRPHSLTVAEGFADPIGFYNPSPVFSWKLPVSEAIQSQTAYRIVVSDTADPKQLIWDSGKVDSEQSVWVSYGGPAFGSRQRLAWKVKFWGAQGAASNWSSDATIEMGLLNNSDWHADWIEVDREMPVPDKVVVVKAEYGNREAAKVADVKDRLNGAIRNGVTAIRVKPARLGGDPAPGMQKSLWVEYEVNGKKLTATVPDNGSFNPYPSLTAQPGYYLRRDFAVKSKIVKARLYASALGIYEFKINGQRVSDDVLSPGYTTYSKRVESLTYDVTHLIREGDNAIGALLGEGWYAGNLLLRKRKDLLALTPKLLGQLELTYADGRTETIVTDKSWKGTDQGPIRAGGYYHGEDYDASKRLGNWTQAGYDDSAWKPVLASPVESSTEDSKRLIVPKRLPAVRVTQRLPAIELTEPEPGKFVFDFGQNLVGVPDMTLPVKAGEKVTIRVAEMLNRDGTLYTENYRSARSQATYVAAEDGEIHYRPSLSFFGFRCVEISGLSAGDALTKESVTANVLHTDFQSTGKFVSSSDKLNQLQSNIRWGQIGNFIDIPTDCPQRDERLGWTGDAQAFLPTSCFNYDVHSFWARWLRSVRDEQNEKGEIPHTVPSTPFGYASPGWADVIVTAPWEVYERTGDIGVLRNNYVAMQKWVAVYENRSTDFIPDLTGWGDWLQPYFKDGNKKGDTAQDLIATAYFGRVARIMSWTATALGKDADAKRYKRMHADIRRAFTAKYFPDGEVHPGANTQTACLMGLGYDLIEDGERKRVTELLLEKFEEADRHLRTGFLGTPLLAPVFDSIGRGDICYELLFKESYPSWFYSIDQGATTMWERWNSYSHADGFGDASMNSFNHYAYGAIGQFMYERIAGLSPDPKNAGYKHFFVRPLIGGQLDSASAELETPYGTAKSGWRRTEAGIVIEAVVPPNTTATVVLPAGDFSQVELNGKPLGRADLNTTSDSTSLELQPGSYKLLISERKSASNGSTSNEEN